jgi:hypothetical protein
LADYQQAVEILLRRRKWRMWKKGWRLETGRKERVCSLKAGEYLKDGKRIWDDGGKEKRETISGNSGTKILSCC